MILSIRDLSCGYGNKHVVDGFSLDVKTGEIVCLLGPNGVGKTTLFKTILGLLPRLGGSVMLDGRDTTDFSPKELAKLIAYVPQAHTPPFAFTAHDVVVMGRLAHTGFFSTPKATDHEVADQVMEQLGISFLSERIYTELSGGERQMTLIGRALAQQPMFLMMDEPTASLDFGNQVQVLSAIKHLSESGLGVIMTTHVPDHLFQCEAKGVLMLRNGEYEKDSAEKLLTAENLERAYGIDVMVLDSEWDGQQVRFVRPVVR